jgi:hypothetical protein
VRDAKRIAGGLAAHAPNLGVEIRATALAYGAPTLRADLGEELRAVLLPHGHATPARVL